MESIWQKDCPMPAFETLQRDIETEVAVIGGGMAGILTARLLADAGVAVTVLEAERIGQGQTRGTTGKITAQHGLIYDRLLQQKGETAAKQYARAALAAVEDYALMVQQRGIDCDFSRQSAFLYSTAARDALRREAAAYLKLGIAGRFLRTLPLPFAVEGALEMEQQAQFHPLKFLRAVAKGLDIYEKTAVTGLQGELLQTAQGAAVRAKKVVFACHFPFINLPGYYFARMHQQRSYLLALQNAKPPEGMYLGVEQNGYTLRACGDLLLFGGEGHRTGENAAGGRYEALRGAAQQYFAGAETVAQWSAQDCITHDGVPYIGQFSETTPHWYVATGFQKWGMTGSMTAATLLRDAVLGHPNENAAVFSPQRFSLDEVGPLMTDGVQAVRGLARQKLAVPQTEIDALPPGHGGVVQVNGQAVGVYKRPDGAVFLVDTRCPHLGCRVEWNPDEHSWDCPCHGSRFDYTGRRISGPAQEGIDIEQLL